jgi:hypothetical protein
MNTLHATINERRTQLSHMQQMAETLPLSEERDRVLNHIEFQLQYLKLILNAVY